MKNAATLIATMILALAPTLAMADGKPLHQEPVRSGWPGSASDPGAANSRRAKPVSDSVAASADAIAETDGELAAALAPRRVVRQDRASEGRLGADVRITDTRWSSWSPAMAVAIDGTLYCVVEDPSSGNYLDVYRSVDGGAVWTYEWSVLTVAQPTEPSVAVGEAEGVQRLLIAYVHGSGTASASVQVFWYDFGSDVTGTRYVETLPYATLSAPRICVDSPEYSAWYPYLTWLRDTVGFDREFQAVQFSRSLDRGETWSAPVELAGAVAAGARPALDFGGTRLYCAYEREAFAGDLDVYLRRSDDFGSTWQPEFGLAVTAMDERSPAVAATPGGDLVIVAFARDYGGGSGHDIDAMITNDGGGVWTGSYLPYTGDDETEPVVASSLVMNRIHALYRRAGDLVLTRYDISEPGVWTDVILANRSTNPDPNDGHALVANPARLGEAMATWGVSAPDAHAVYAGGAYQLGRYLVIAANSAFASAATPLVDWKYSLGHTVEVITFSMIRAAYPGGDDAEAIWNYLSDHREGLRHVLLVGDVDLLPMRTLYPDGDPAYPPGDPRHDSGLGFGSDFYYAKLTQNWDQDGDDRWGEFTDDNLDPEANLLVGRVPLENSYAVEQWCEDLVAFEQDRGAWKQRLLMAHGFLNYAYGPGDVPCDTGMAGERMRLDLLVPAGWGWSRLYEKGGMGPSAFPAEDGLSRTNYELYSGYDPHGIVSVMAHGNPTSLASHRWLQDLNANGLADLPAEWCYNEVTNTYSVAGNPVGSFALLTGCSTGVLFGNDPGFLASGLRSRYLIRAPRYGTMIKEYIERGAPAAIASSAGSDYGAHWLNPGDKGTQSFIYALVENIVTMGMGAGEAFYAAQRDYFYSVGPQRGIRVFNFFGDPSLRIEGALPPEAAPLFAQARRSSDRRELPPIPTERVRLLPTTLWSETAELAGCASANALLTLAGGDLLAGGIAKEDTLRNQGALFRSADGGETWTRQDLAGSWSIETLLAAQGGALLAGGLTDAGGVIAAAIHRSTDGGLTWSQRLEAEDGCVTDLAAGPDGTLWAAGGWNGRVYTSSDHGQSWSQWSSLGAGATIRALLPWEGGVIVALDESESFPALLRSGDGSIWNAVDAPPELIAASDLIEQDGLLYAAARDADQGRVLRSGDGWSWEALAEFPDPALARSAVCLAGGPDGELYAGLSSGRGPAVSAVYLLAADEVEWEPHGGLIDMASDVTALLPRSGVLYAATGHLYGNVYACRTAGETGVDDGTTAPAPGASLLLPPWPNPCNPTAQISFDLAESAGVELSIFDERGRRLRRLIDAALPAGRHEAVWDGRDDAGRDLPSGQYLIRLALNGDATGPARKLILLR